MNWCVIRLELASCPRFPNGSAGRAYLLRLPLDEEGRIGRKALDREPRRATVRRFWPSEPDKWGYVVHVARGWAFAFEANGDPPRTILQELAAPFRLDEEIALHDLDGLPLRFRVTSLAPG